MDKAPVRRAADAVQRARARTLQIIDRIGELRERTQWMTRDRGDSMTVEERAAKGSTPEQAARAAQYVRLAKERAAEAAERSVTAHEHAALAHDHAAETLEETSASGVADCVSYRERARRHRAFAAAEREAAQALSGLAVARDNSGFPAGETITGPDVAWPAGGTDVHTQATTHSGQEPPSLSSPGGQSGTQR
jgi:hypothetical protein